MSRAARGFLEFVDRAVTPFHAVAVMASRLRNAGYVELRECDDWPVLAAGSKYYVTRNESSIVAFAIGGKYEPGNGIKIVAGHTDSPNLALKPKTKSRAHGFAGVRVQPYGGGLWHTWFDRDLTIAGRLIVKTESDKLASKLVHIQKPFLRIPNLAIHLTTAKERETGFAPNKEAHLLPVLATEKALSLRGEGDAGDGQCPTIMKELAAAVGTEASAVVDFDLSIVDTQPSTIGGITDEFILAPRIDNLLSCYCALEAMLESDESQSNDSMVRMLACFDHEEVGSASSPGAGGTLIPDVIERLQLLAPGTRARAIANSFLLSVDGAHGIHPNYSDRHEQQHRPMLNAGPVIKYNANQRYSTSGETAAVISALGDRAGVPIQKVCVKNDSPCGSTIGPITTSLSGIPGADIGNAMLSMHSIREMCGADDVSQLTKLLGSFLQDFEQVRLR